MQILHLLNSQVVWVLMVVLRLSAGRQMEGFPQARPLAAAA